MTSKFQPMDQGVLWLFNAKYKKKLVLDYFTQHESNGKTEAIDLKEAIYFVIDSWKAVESKVIVNCFNKIGILENSVGVTDIIKEIEVEELKKLIEKLGLAEPMKSLEYLDLENKEDNIENFEE